ncbi:MAG TPA: hypothetical protein VHN37_09275 [Actinomycetota bacterium]|nr:hypothetical protein [Actinomycetota bacterium]
MSDWDRQTTPSGVEGPQWVSAAEAADLAGVTPGTVRYWARNGLIVSEVVEGPAGERMLVRLDEVLQHARQDGPSRRSSSPAAPPAPGGAGPGEVVTELPARTSELAPILKSIPEIMAQLTAATDRAARAETKVEFLSAQVADLRRRLAEAEAGRDADPAAAIPEAWGSPPEAEPAVEDEPASAGTPAGGGWPAPPAEALDDEPREEAPAAPAAIDWTSGAAVTGTPPADGPPAGPPPAAEPPQPGISLNDIWNEPAKDRGAASAPEPRAPEPVGAGGRAEEPSGVDWHEPARPGPGAPPPEPSPPKPANAPVPEGDDFYGPRRRRWFRRRR